MKFKIISIFLFLMMLPQGMSIGSYNGHILYVGGSGEGNYTSIQDAINDANDGDTIFVYSGTYHEKINTYSKKICLIGENEKTTIIDGDGDDCNILEAASYNLEIHNFTITNGGTPGAGIHIYKKHYVTITHCTFSNIIESSIIISLTTPIRHLQILKAYGMTEALEIIGAITMARMKIMMESVIHHIPYQGGTILIDILQCI